MNLLVFLVFFSTFDTSAMVKVDDNSDFVDLKIDINHKGETKEGLQIVQLKVVPSQPVSIDLSKEDALFKDSHKISKISSEELKKNVTFTEAEEGYDIEVLSKVGILQLPLQLKNKNNGEVSFYDINLAIKKEKAEVGSFSEEELHLDDEKSEPPKQSNLDLEDKKAWGKILFGVGYNYLRFNQNTTTPYNSLLTYESFDGPGFYIGLLKTINNHWDMSAEIKNAIGSTSSGQGASVRQGNYQWITSSIEGIYKSEPFKMPLKMINSDYQFQWTTRFGFQYHIVPFLVRETNQLVNLETNELTFLTVGGGLQWHRPESLWSYETYFRVQYNVKTGSGFNISNPFSFDGSVGFSREITKKWSIGGFWYGQFQTFSVDGIQDSVSGNTVEGSISLFYSNLEVREIYSF